MRDFGSEVVQGIEESKVSRDRRLGAGSSSTHIERNESVERKLGYRIGVMASDPAQ
jgi:hypothetical protein